MISAFQKKSTELCIRNKKNKNNFKKIRQIKMKTKLNKQQHQNTTNNPQAAIFKWYHYYFFFDSWSQKYQARTQSTLLFDWSNAGKAANLHVLHHKLVCATWMLVMEEENEGICTVVARRAAYWETPLARACRLLPWYRHQLIGHQWCPCKCSKLTFKEYCHDSSSEG